MSRIIQKNFFIVLYLGQLSQLNHANSNGNYSTLTTTTTTTGVPVAGGGGPAGVGGLIGTFQIEIDESIKRRIDEKLRECSSGDSDSDSEHNIYTPKAVDLPSAQRLAKRLYYLDGFKLNDVVRHLSKKYSLIFFISLSSLIFYLHYISGLTQLSAQDIYFN